MVNLSEGPTFCGGFTYDLIYVSGPLTASVAVQNYQIEQYTATQHRITGIATTDDWIGTH